LKGGPPGKATSQNRPRNRPTQEPVREGEGTVYLQKPRPPRVETWWQPANPSAKRRNKNLEKKREGGTKKENDCWSCKSWGGQDPVPTKKSTAIGKEGTKACQRGAGGTRTTRNACKTQDCPTPREKVGHGEKKITIGQRGPNAGKEKEQTLPRGVSWRNGGTVKK